MPDRGAHLECPVCHGQDLRSSIKQEDVPLALLYEGQATSFFGPPGYLRVYSLTCASCGHVMLFDADVIDRK
ncbi:hypothetical protein [Chthonobacter rhizosphaerae]|uniref:hypothetical protein n=1 Tax=Chthonobacter rhizosphaerae TaxID=2735553 RepID=UPI0015EEB873|nr:hypothetical protein [Chthonobacter rhizosphaerae]